MHEPESSDAACPDIDYLRFRIRELGHEVRQLKEQNGLLWSKLYKLMWEIENIKAQPQPGLSLGGLAR